MSIGVSAGGRFRRGIERARRLSPRRIVLLLLLLALFPAAYLGHQRFVAVPPSTPTVQTVPVRVGSVVSTVTAIGSVVTTRQAKLSFSADGKLEELNVAVGASVKAGQPLARLDTAPLQSKLISAESSLKIARFNLEQLKRGATPEELEAAKIAYELAAARYQETLAGPTEAELQSARAAVEQAKANLASAQAKLDELKAGPDQAQLQSAQAAVESARSALLGAREKLDLLKAGPTAAELAAAQAAVEQAKGALISAEDRYQMVMNGNLSDAGGTSNSAVKQAYNTAKANYETAVQKLQDLQAGPTAANLQSAESAVISAQASYDSAVSKLEQMKRGPTAVELASAESAVEQARASLLGAEAKLKELQAGPKESDILSARSALITAQIQLASKTTVKETDLIQQEEQVRQAEAALQQARLDLESASITAPFDGIVSAIGANVGERVGGGSAVVTLVDPTAFRIDVTVDENDVARLAVGQPAVVSFDAMPDWQIRGRVAAVAPVGTTQQGVVSYLASIGVNSPPQPVSQGASGWSGSPEGRTVGSRTSSGEGASPQAGAARAGSPQRYPAAGMSATATIETERKDGVLLVPNRALRTQGRNRVVDVMVGEKTEMRTVQTGVSNDQFTEIVSGLQEGELVVIPSTTTTQPRVNVGSGVPQPAMKVVR